MNPTGYAPKIEHLGMAPRPGGLDGKTVYLVDVHFVDGDKLLQQIQAWFAEHLPKVKTVLASKAGVYTEDDPELFSEIKERDAAVVMAVGNCSTCAPAVAVHPQSASTQAESPF